MIAVGQRLPLDLPLATVEGGERRSTTLGALLTRRTIVSVYMRNNTPGCDRQVDALVEHAAEFDRLGWNIVALSRDTCGSHLKYAAKKAVPFTLISDPDDTFAKEADAIVEKTLYGRTHLGPARCALALDRDGTVLAVIEKVDTKAHVAQLRAELALQSSR